MRYYKGLTPSQQSSIQEKYLNQYVYPGYWDDFDFELEYWAEQLLERGFRVHDQYKSRRTRGGELKAYTELCISVESHPWYIKIDATVLAEKFTTHPYLAHCSFSLTIDKSDVGFEMEHELEDQDLEDLPPVEAAIILAQRSDYYAKKWDGPRKTPVCFEDHLVHLVQTELDGVIQEMKKSYDAQEDWLASEERMLEDFECNPEWYEDLYEDVVGDYYEDEESEEQEIFVDPRQTGLFREAA